MKVGYARVSSQEQARDTSALEQQQERLRQAGCDVIYTDVESGKKDNRRELKRALASLGSGDVLVATRLDRLTRSPRYNEQLLRRFSKDNSPGLLLLDDGLDFRSVTGRLSARIMAAVAAGEVERLAERVAHGRAHRQAKGGHGAKPPWGFRRDQQGIGLEIDPELQEICLETVRHFVRHRSMRGTSAWLQEQHGISKGRTALRRWLQNPALAGGVGRCKGTLLVDPVTGEEVRRPPEAGQYDAIEWDRHVGLITRAEWHEIDRALRTNAEAGAGNRAAAQPGWWSRRFYCDACGHGMHRHWARIRCSTANCSCRFANAVRLELAQGSLRRAIEWMHGELSLRLAPFLARAESPASDPAEVLQLLDEIEALRRITGTEQLILVKQQEVDALRQRSQGQVLTTAAALQRLLPLLSHPWRLSDEELHQLGIDAELRARVQDRWVVEVRSERFGCSWSFDPTTRRETFQIDTDLLPSDRQRLGLEQGTALQRTAAWWGCVDDELDRRSEATDSRS